MFGAFKVKILLSWQLSPRAIAKHACWLEQSDHTQTFFFFLSFSEGAQDFLTLSLLACVIKTLAFTHTNLTLPIIIEAWGEGELTSSPIFAKTTGCLWTGFIHTSSAWPNCWYHISEDIDLSRTAFYVAAKSALLAFSSIVHKACWFTQCPHWKKKYFLHKETVTEKSA